MISKKKNEDAVSPVIGVMLMLVVTVVIAAVVVTFSTGLAGSTGTTPTALFEVSGTDTYQGGLGEELAYVNIKHKGGDTIPLSDLQITLESVGGSNNGIINALTASDNMGYYDSESGVYIAPTMTQEEYNAKKEKSLKSARTAVQNAEKNLNDQSYIDYYGKEQLQKALDDAKAMLQKKETDFKNTYDKDLYGYFEGGSTYPIAVLGQTVPTKSTVSTGDIIHICPRSTNDGNTAIIAGTAVKWTISYIPTNSVIAKGEFDVIAD